MIEKSFFIFIFLLIAVKSEAQPIAVYLKWKYENFPLKVQVYSVKKEKFEYISETRNVDNLASTAGDKKISDHLNVQINSSQPAVLVVENTTDQDLYFFAVPHELRPHEASTGHYFECLCIGKLYKVEAKKTWYRIVRVNLDKNFSGKKSFEIEHQIIGVSKNDALGKYRERLYDH